jgi:hypothetical protein
LWKDYSRRDNECIIEWTARVREVCEREIHSRTKVAKQGMPNDFWFKLITRESNGEVSIEEHAWR